ncbi:MAG: DNA repair exonuclease, partial [Planctomycetota bacterium]|nr:DNA repair exonuclease [Planctomycetota bacterium]
MPGSVKILHTSDLHLDSRFVGISDRAVRARRRGEHCQVIRRIVNLATSESVDLILIVGDLFDETTYQLETISYLVDEFRRFQPKQVFIAPGLVDAHHSQSPYALFDWGENVHIFESSEFSSVSIPELGVKVHGIAPDREHLEANFLENLRADGDESIQIGMLFGSNVDRVPGGAETPFPFSDEDVKSTGLDYLALGGYHSYQRFGSNTVACYSGMPEPTGFDELGEKCVVLAEVSREKVQVSPRNISGLVFHELDVDISGISATDKLARRVTKALKGQDRGGSLIRVRLVGTPDPGIVIDPPVLIQRVHWVPGHLQIEDRTGAEPDWADIHRKSTLAGE